MTGTRLTESSLCPKANSCLGNRPVRARLSRHRVMANSETNSPPGRKGFCIAHLFLREWRKPRAEHRLAQRNAAAGGAGATDSARIHAAIALFARLEAKIAHKMSGEIALKEIFMT